MHLLRRHLSAPPLTVIFQEPRLLAPSKLDGNPLVFPAARGRMLSDMLLTGKKKARAFLTA